MSVLEQARGLLGRELTAHGVTVRITEVEAYGGVTDPASHAYTRTARSEIMYGPPWRLYVYRIHGHHCANIVTGPSEEAAAVLLRAGEVVDGQELACERRGEVPHEALGRGPGNLCRALGITMADLDIDVRVGPSVVLAPKVDDVSVSEGPRVGVRRAADRPWRFWITGDPTVSTYRRHARAESSSDDG
ncbi:3-methyladenine DNA glycosylase [Aeromicrobium sp. PE09-221]|uniref:DNA-3-methyladenine glycosylase n=1 Tax=Aeromicrobium sp. PE09-221 TaxID=1898043 RepID=UPI000B3E5D45|nr:DNA-3-methyladenine glycosylase [Aeromicrobium sp. PE09-221]OUZ09783.1 3-methyladenine DNA glycosylase [Aeromicrobium sp. PE09-221]